MKPLFCRISRYGLAVAFVLIIGPGRASAQPGTECWDCIEWGGCFFCQGQVDWGWDDCSTPSCGHCSLGAFCTVGLASTVAADGSLISRIDVTAVLQEVHGPGLIDVDADGTPEFEYQEDPEGSRLIQLCNGAIVWHRAAVARLAQVRESSSRIVF